MWSPKKFFFFTPILKLKENDLCIKAYYLNMRFTSSSINHNALLCATKI